MYQSIVALISVLCLHTSQGVALGIRSDGIGSHSMAEVTEGLELLLLLNEHGKNGLEGTLKVIPLHLGNVGEGSSSLKDGAAAEPYLITLSTITDKGELGHVWSSTAVGATSHSHKDLLVTDVHLVQQGAHSANVLGHLMLGLGLGETAKGKGGTGHGKTGKGINLLQGLDTMLPKDSIDSILVLGVDIPQNKRLGRAEDHVDVVLVHQNTESSLEAEIVLILDTAIVHVQAVEHLAVTLVPPSHPIHVLPLLHFSPGLDLLAEVALHKGAEVVNAKSVDEVLHTGVGTDVTVAVVALTGQDGLHELHHVLLGDVAEVVGGTGKGVGLVVGAAHTTSDHDVESLELAGLVADDDAANVVGVDVERVVTGDGNANLQLAGEVAIAVERLDGIGKDDAPAGIEGHGLVDVVLLHLGGPLDLVGGLLPVEPDVVKGGSHGAEKLGKDLGPLSGVVILGGVEGGRRGHDVTANITAGTNGGRTNVHNGRDDGLEVALADAVQLEALAGGGTEIALAHVGAKVVEETVQVGGKLTGGLLQTEHELVVLVLAADLTIGLHVRSVVLEDLHGILGNTNLLGGELLWE